MARKSEKNFEKAMGQLEESVKRLEEGDISLEESIKEYKNGMELAAFCMEVLKNAQQEIEVYEASHYKKFEEGED